MNGPKDGGPAFPVHPDTHPMLTGTTLRDVFAISVSKRLGDWTPYIEPVWIVKNGVQQQADWSDPEYQEAARNARAKYIWAEADAMLAAREVKP